MIKDPIDLVAEARADAETAKTDKLEETFSQRKQRLGERSLDHWKAANDIYTIEAAADLIEELRERLAACRARELAVGERYETLLRSVSAQEAAVCLGSVTDIELTYRPMFDTIEFQAPCVKINVPRPYGVNLLTDREGRFWCKEIADQYAKTLADYVFHLFKSAGGQR